MLIKYAYSIHSLRNFLLEKFIPITSIFSGDLSTENVKEKGNLNYICHICDVSSIRFLRVKTKY